MAGEIVPAPGIMTDKLKRKNKARKKRHKESVSAKSLAESPSKSENNTNGSFVDEFNNRANRKVEAGTILPSLHKQGLRYLNNKAGEAREGASLSRPGFSCCHPPLNPNGSEVCSPVSDKSDRTITQTNFNHSPHLPSRPKANTVDMAKMFEDGPAGIQEEAVSHAFTSVALPFKFDSLDSRLKCPKPDCRKLTSCWESVVVICPACGPNSFTRYCCKEHLYQDIRRHWLLDCGKHSIPVPVDLETVRPSQLPRTSYITGHFSNHIERHRQAVYRAMESADYFIFDDNEQLTSDPPTKLEWQLVRGTGKVQKTISFLNDGTMLCPHAFFNHHILQCLKFGGPLAENSSNMAFHMIRDFLIVEGSWTEEILTALCMQIAFEWGYKVPEHFYNVEQVNFIYRHFGRLPMPMHFQQGWTSLQFSH